MYAGAGADALTGIVRQWAAVESWAAAGLMGALAAMMHDDDTGTPVLSRRTGMAQGWDDSLNYEIAAALAMGPMSAQNLAGLAWTLRVRLPGIGRLLAGGTLTKSKARLVAQVFEPLDEDEAARAEALIAGELEGKTYPQVERLAWRAALAVAPDVAERRRSRAERAARVTVFREQAGTVGLSGRDLPAAEALAGHANVAARAAVYAASGAFRARTPAACRPRRIWTCSAGSRPPTGSRSPPPGRSRPMSPARTPPATMAMMTGSAGTTATALDRAAVMVAAETAMVPVTVAAAARLPSSAPAQAQQRQRQRHRRRLRRSRSRRRR